LVVAAGVETGVVEVFVWALATIGQISIVPKNKKINKTLFFLVQTFFINYN